MKKDLVTYQFLLWGRMYSTTTTLGTIMFQVYKFNSFLYWWRQTTMRNAWRMIYKMS